jgi:hypothetical protein
MFGLVASFPMTKAGEQKTCTRCGGTMTYESNKKISDRPPASLLGHTATGWFCAACPHTEIHVVLR